MDLRKLEYFEAVCRLRNFTKAAEEQHVSQPSITNAIRSLEDELGVNLLERNKRKVTLTMEGDILYQRTIKILDDVSNTVRLMLDLGISSKKVVRLGSSPIIGGTIYPHVLIGFRERYPEIQLHITEQGTHGIYEEILKGNLDLGYAVLLPEHETQFHSQMIADGRVHVLLHVDNPLNRLSEIPIEALADQPIYHTPMHTFLHRTINEQFERNKMKPMIMGELQQMSSIFNLISYGKGVSFIMHHEMISIQKSTELTTRPLLPVIPFQAGFLWSKDTYLSEAARVLIQYVVQKSS